MNPDFNEETLERPPLQSRFQYAVINAVLLGKNYDLFFLFVYYMFWNPDNKITNVDQMCHILILLHVQHAMSFFLKTSTNPPPLPDSTILHLFLLHQLEN